MVSTMVAPILISYYFPMVSLWFLSFPYVPPCGFPLWLSYGAPLWFPLWFSYGFPMVIPMVSRMGFLWFPYSFPVNFLRFALCFSYVFSGDVLDFLGTLASRALRCCCAPESLTHCLTLPPPSCRRSVGSNKVIKLRRFVCLFFPVFQGVFVFLFFWSFIFTQMAH